MKLAIMIKGIRKIYIAAKGYLFNWQDWSRTIRFVAFMTCTAMAWLLFTPFQKLEVEHYNFLIENISNPLASVIFFYLITSATCGTLYTLFAKRLWKSFE